MEQFGRAYVQAVAAAVGCAFWVQNPDLHSVDLAFGRISPSPTNKAPRLEAQLKPSYAAAINDTVVSYDLPMKNYDDLRIEELTVPRVLILIVVPENVEDWIEQDEESLRIRRCGYWLSLRGAPQVDNMTTRVVHLPRNQVFDVDGLSGIFERLENGDLP